MFELESKLYGFLMGYTDLLTRDIDEALWEKPSCEGGNPPVWIMGHLAVATDYAARVMGLPRVIDRAWHVNFGPGSKPLANQSPYPSKAEQLAAYHAGHARVTEALKSADAAALAAPHALEILKGTPIETNAELLAHLLTTHEATHLGQLSAWRRQMGLKGVLNI